MPVPFLFLLMLDISHFPLLKFGFSQLIGAARWGVRVSLYCIHIPVCGLSFYVEEQPLNFNASLKLR